MLRKKKTCTAKEINYQKIVMYTMPAWKSTVTCDEKIADSRQNLKTETRRSDEISQTLPKWYDHG